MAGSGVDRHLNAKAGCAAGTSHGGWRWALLPLIMAFALGLQGASLDVFWVDEIYSISNMGAYNPPYSPAQIVESLLLHSPEQTPFFYLLGAAWAWFAGWSPVALRLLSTVFGVVMIACLYRFGKDAFGERTGLVAAALMATSAYILWYFHEFRMYSLQMLLGVGQLWMFWRLSRGRRASVLAWTFFVATAALLLYTQVLSAPLLFALGLHHLLFARKNRRWLQICVGWAVALALFLPMGLHWLGGIGGASNPAHALISDKTLTAFLRLAANGVDLLWLPLMSLLLLAIWRGRDREALKLLLIAAFMLLALQLMNWQVKYILASRIRYFLLLWIPLCLLFAFGLTAFARARLISGVFLLCWVIAGSQLTYMEIVTKYAGSTDSVLLYPPLHRYVEALHDKLLQQDYLVGFQRRRQLVKAEKHGYSTADYYTDVLLGIDGWFLDAERTNHLEDDLKRIRETTAWLLLAHDPTDPPPNMDAARAALMVDYVACPPLVDESDLRIERFVQRTLPCEHAPRGAEYDVGVRLLDRYARHDAAAQFVDVLTWWRVKDDAALERYNISLQILRLDGHKVSQIDRHLTRTLLPWRVLQLPTAELPAGDYQVALIVYDRGSGAKLAAVDRATGARELFLPVADFRIEERA